MAEPEQVALPEGRGKRFLVNVLWSWAGIALNLGTAVFLSPYIVSKLGSDGYGIWQLVYSMIGYFALVDIGFRSGVVRFTALYRARHEDEKVNEVLNSVFIYYLFASAFLILLTVPLYVFSDRVFQVSDRYRGEFAKLIIIVGINHALGVVLNTFNGAVEGFQRFDLAGRIRVIIFSLRAGGFFGLLAAGYGLVGMGLYVTFINCLLIAAFYTAAKRDFPQLSFARRYMRKAVLKQLFGYGIHTLVATVATQTLEQAASIILGMFRTVSEVAYLNMPLRLLMYASEALAAVRNVTLPQAAELAAQNENETIIGLTVLTNRYCLVLYGPLAICALIFGSELMRIWVGEEFAIHSAPLLPLLLPGMYFATGQNNSQAVLFGIAHHQTWSRFLLAEAVVTSVLMLLLAPQYGIVAVATIISGGMLVVRGLAAALLLCQRLRYPLGRFLANTYRQPLLVAAPIALAGWAWKRFVWTEPPGTWTVLSAAAVVSLAALAGGYFFCVEPAHRQALRKWLHL